MYDEENNEEEKDDRNTCPTCGLRQYGSVCANCGTDIEDEEKDPDKRKEDDSDEYDRRERR